MGNFIDSCFCIGQAKTDGDEKRYIKTTKRTEVAKIILNERNTYWSAPLKKGEDNFSILQGRRICKKKKDLIKRNW